MALTDNLISAWELDEASGNALDSHGSNTLTENNGIATGTGLVHATARDLESVSLEYFSLADNASLSTGDINFTWEAWCKLESIGAYMALVCKWSFGSNSREYILDVESNKFLWSVSADGTAWTAREATTFGTLSTGTWYHVIAWHDATNNQIGIAVNAGTADTTSYSSGVADGTGAFRLGSIAGLDTDSNALFDGLLGPVRFWKRVLTSGERTQLYNSGFGLSYDRFSATPPSTGLYQSLISYWKLDEASGAAIDTHGFNDLVENGTIGTASGKINGARDFERSESDYFARADNADLSTGDIDFTVQAWVNFESVNVAQAVVGKWGSATANQEYLIYLDSSANLYFAYRSSGGSFAQVQWSATLSAATWYLIHGWHDATNNQTGIVVNAGTPVTSAHATGIQEGAGPFEIGRSDEGSNLLDALVDEVGFWKRVLTSGERTTLYNGGAGLAYADFGGGAPEWPWWAVDTLRRKRRRVRQLVTA